MANTGENNSPRKSKIINHHRKRAMINAKPNLCARLSRSPIAKSPKAAALTLFLLLCFYEQNNALAQLVAPPLSPAFVESALLWNAPKHECKDGSCAARQTQAFRFALDKTQRRTANSHQSGILGINVLRYNLWLDWRRPLSGIADIGSARHYKGVQTITILLDSLWDERSPFLRLHASERHLRIDSAFLLASSATFGDSFADSLAAGDLSPHSLANAEPLRATFEPENSPFRPDAPREIIALRLPRFYKHGDTLALRLCFTHIADSNDKDGIGFLLFAKKRLGTVRRGNDSVFIPERLAYTMSQPYGARRWMPCHDVPFDKAFVAVRIQTPSSYTAISNGLLTDSTTHSDGSLTRLWRHRYPIAPYLVAVTASVYDSYREWHKKISNPNDSIPIDHWFWKEDDTDLPLNNNNYNVRASFGITRGTIEAFERLFGDYPFERYGHVVVQPFFAGGMEHQTISTINRAWLRGSAAAGVAHEIIHQWFGNMATCRSWEHIWLNEGTATYGEALWYESWGGSQWRKVALEGFKREYFESESRFQSVFVAAPSSIDEIFNYATTYCKGAWVHHFMRNVFGDSAYFSAMRLFLQRFTHSAATTEDLCRAFEETLRAYPPKHADPAPALIFEQWIYGSGHPELRYSWRRLRPPLSHPNDSALIEVSVAQTQSNANAPVAYRLPLELTFLQYSKSAGDTLRFRRTVALGSRVQRFVLSVPFLPDSVALDEEETFLREITFSRHAGSETDVARTILAYPSPLPRDETLTLEYTLDENASVTIEIANTLHQTLLSLPKGEQEAGWHVERLNLRLPAGSYTARVRLGSAAVSVRRFIIAP
jgi:hypothetical protein